MHAPQIIVIIWLCLGLGITLSKHGEPKEGKESFWRDASVTVILMSLLYWGGFFGGAR